MHGEPQIAGRVGKGQLLRSGTPPARRWWRRGDAQIADEPQQVRPLQAEGARRVGAIATRLVERRFDEPSLELEDRAMIAGGRRRW